MSTAITTTNVEVAAEVVATVVDTNRTYEQNAQLVRDLHAAGWTIKAISAMTHMPYVKTRFIAKGLDGIKPRCASCGTMTTRISEVINLPMCVACEVGHGIADAVTTAAAEEVAAA